MRFPDAEILVMARAPVPGEAKTRLIPALGERGAAELHAFLVERLLAQLSHAAVAPLTLCCTPGIAHPFFTHCRHKFGVTLRPQHGNDLGERLYHALATALQSRRMAVVIGCDIPDLDSHVITRALQALQQGADTAIAPTEDGGYALLALDEAEVSLFRGVEWGSDLVLQQTLKGLKALNRNYRLLDTLWDLDRPEDLRRLLGISLPPHLESLLERATAVG